MVEVHLVRLEALAAILARHLAEFAEELERRGLTGPNSLDLFFAVSRVITDIEGALISRLPKHVPS